MIYIQDVGKLENGDKHAHRVYSLMAFCTCIPPCSETGIAAIEPSPLIDRAACIRADRKARGLFV